ncbi:MAG: hypothetical protein ABIB71_07465 [Candidatus Woesearchaeota archaeon]
MSLKTYEAKSILLGRKKKKKDEQDDVRPCFISLFNGNNPHLTAEVPLDILEFDSIHKIIIKGLDVNYLLPGNDIVVNDLEQIDVLVEGPHITVTGKQKKD